MERFGHRGNVLLGYNASSSLEPSSSRDSDDVGVDFNDVFGGPPRRSAVHDIRYSFGGGRMVDSDQDKAVSRSPWPGLSTEKPVFGEESGGDRRRYPSDDFYDDIFRGGDGPYSSPRSSKPGSRVLSPARPLPPKAEPFATSLPAQFSLPAKLTKAMDLPTFGSSPRSANKHKDGSSTPNTSLSRFSSQSFPEQNGQNLLSHELSFSNEEASYITKSPENEVGGNLKGDAKSVEVLIKSGQFHFSIYKWPTKGIPFLSPLREGKNSTFKGKVKFERCVSSKGRIEHEAKVSELLKSNVHGSDSCLLTEDLSAIVSNTAKSCQIVEEEGFIYPESKPFETMQIGETKPISLPEIGLSEGIKKETSTSKQEGSKPDLKPLRSLLHDEIEEQGDEDIIKMAEGKENLEKVTAMPHSNVGIINNVMEHEEKESNNKRAEVNKDPVGSPRNSGDNQGINRVKGKVKDFVKIFNQETPSKIKINVITRSQSSRWKSTENYGADSEVRENATTNNKVVSNVNMKPDASFTVENKSEKSKKQHSGQKNMKPEASLMVEERIDKSNKQQSDRKATKPGVNMKPDASFPVEEMIDKSNKQRSEPKTTSHKSNDNRSAQMDAAPIPESLPRDSNVTLGDIDDMFHDNFQIKELSPDEEKPSKTEEDSDALRASDSKIQHWSNGKKGNIRSLLSTLQYVLWPESGWKPVPLVDVIEGNQVKRAYQRALLCLHPDKLQQKGAASHQKYIAEKVFDILQEAWEHFNSIGSL